MRQAIFTALAALALAIPFEPAKAGGVVIHYREIATSAASRGVESVVLPAANAVSNSADAVATQGATAGPAGQQAPGSTTAPGSGTGKAPPGVNVPTPGNGTKGDEMAGNTNAFGSTRFNLEDGSAPLDAMGCGGATTARGPVGLLPFGIAALALILRRRR